MVNVLRFPVKNTVKNRKHLVSFINSAVYNVKPKLLYVPTKKKMIAKRKYLI